MTDETTDDSADDEQGEASERSKHAIAGGTEFVKTLRGDDGSEDSEGDTDG